MNDLRALTDSILAKTQAEAESIIKKAEEQAAIIMAEAKQKADIKSKRIAEEFQRKAEDLERRSKIEVELSAKKKILDAKHQLIERAFNQALAALKDLPAEKRIRFLAEKLAAAGINGGGEVKGSGPASEWNSIIKVANEIMARTGSTSQLVLSKEQPEFDGGFLLTGRGYVINGSYEALLEEFREELVPRIAEFLFENEKG